MQVSELMAPDPLVVSDAATVSEAARRMDEEGVRHLAVVRAGALVGVLSDRDLLSGTGRLVPRLGEELQLVPGTVRDVMQAEPVTVLPEETVSRAAELLSEWGIGCLPVVRSGRLVGLLTETDVLDVYAASCAYGRRSGPEDPSVASCMTPEVTTAAPSTTLAEATRTMGDGDFRHLPIVDGGRVVGIVSDRDLRRAAGRALPRDTPLVSVMSTRVATADPDAPLSRAARQMADAAIGALPVVDGRRRLVGILTVTDVLRHCVRALAR